MLLAIDVGNTHTTLGLWDGQAWRQLWRLRTSHHRTADEYGVLLSSLLRTGDYLGAVRRIVLSSVVPSVTATLSEACERYAGRRPLLVRADIPLGIRVATDNPAEVGTDRLANTVAAHHLYPGGSIVIDMGTATTFDVVSGAGDLLGVVIAPGLRLAADALSGGTAQLSNVALSAPPSVIGRNTVHAMQSGIIFGYTGLVEGVVSRLRQAMTALGEAPATVIGTGGWRIVRCQPV